MLGIQYYKNEKVALKNLHEDNIYLALCTGNKQIKANVTGKPKVKEVFRALRQHPINTGNLSLPAKS